MWTSSKSFSTTIVISRSLALSYGLFSHEQNSLCPFSSSKTCCTCPLPCAHHRMVFLAALEKSDTSWWKAHVARSFAEYICWDCHFCSVLNTFSKCLPLSFSSACELPHGFCYQWNLSLVAETVSMVIKNTPFTWLECCLWLDLLWKFFHYQVDILLIFVFLRKTPSRPCSLTSCQLAPFSSDIWTTKC